MDLSSWFSDVQTHFESARDEHRAQAQSAYMKHQFHFLGLSSPIRKHLQKPFYSQKLFSNSKLLESALLLLWEQSCREYQYFALDLARKYSKYFDETFFSCLEKLIITKSWWDTVDLLASSLLGPLALKYPSIREQVVLWIESPNLWKRRSALLFQLKYKDQTDESLLFNLCQSCLHETNFFIRKGIGWVLREYSKTKPHSVSQFVMNNKEQMSFLSLREASKYL